MRTKRVLAFAAAIALLLALSGCGARQGGQAQSATAETGKADEAETLGGEVRSTTAEGTTASLPETGKEAKALVGTWSSNGSLFKFNADGTLSITDVDGKNWTTAYTLTDGVLTYESPLIRDTEVLGLKWVNGNEFTLSQYDADGNRFDLMFTRVTE